MSFIATFKRWIMIVSCMQEVAMWCRVLRTLVSIPFSELASHISKSRTELVICA